MKFSINLPRTDLKSAGIIQVDYTQEQPPRLLVRVNTATVLSCISVDHSSARLKTKNARFRSLPQSNTKGNRITRCQVQRTNWNYWSPAQQRNEIMRLISRTGGLAKLNSVEMGNANVGTDQAEVIHANLATCIRQQDKAAAPTKPAYQLFPFCETGSSLSAKLDVPKVENWIAPFYETKSSLSAKLFIQIEVTNTTTTKQEVEPVASQEGWSRSGNSEITKPSNSITTCLVFPDALDKRRQASALKDISCAPGPLQQSILDEWDGALQSGKTIRNIAGWLDSVVEKANEGTLFFGLSDDIAEIRKGRERQVERALLKTTHTATLGTSDGIAVEPPVLNPEAVNAARERLRQLGTEMRNKNSGISN